MNGAPSSVISVRDLRIGYGDRVLLQNIRFDVRRAEVFVILGASGCGKSTLFKNMIGLHQSLDGEVWIEGRKLTTATSAERPSLLRKFGTVFQGGALFGSLTVLENVRFPLDQFTALPEPVKETIALAKLKLVGLAGTGGNMPSELSGGMQKRAAIARAMALDPGILFMDEPSAGLDPVTSAGLDVLIRSLSRQHGITFVIVTHELPSIYAIADRVIMLDSRTRTVVAEGNPTELREHAQDPWVRRFFNREPDPLLTGAGL
jgi:phospholipid/cholesterol/gamma-HCH transport system ATP-binding protein